MAALDGKKVVMVIAPKDFRDEELAEPRRILSEAGAQVVVACSGTSPASGMLGAKVTPDIEYTTINPEDYDGLVFIGGYGAKQYFDDGKSHDLARKSFEGGKVVAAICIAPSILANAGILSGKKATAFPCEEENLKAKGATYTGEDVTVDGKLVTGKGPEAAVGFGEALLKSLSA